MTLWYSNILIFHLENSEKERYIKINFIFHSIIALLRNFLKKRLTSKINFFKKI